MYSLDQAANIDIAAMDRIIRDMGMHATHATRMRRAHTALRDEKRTYVPKPADDPAARAALDHTYHPVDSRPPTPVPAAANKRPSTDSAFDYVEAWEAKTVAGEGATQEEVARTAKRMEAKLSSDRRGGGGARDPFHADAAPAAYKATPPRRSARGGPPPPPAQPKTPPAQHRSLGGAARTANNTPSTTSSRKRAPAMSHRPHHQTSSNKPASSRSGGFGSGSNSGPPSINGRGGVRSKGSLSSMTSRGPAAASNNRYPPQQRGRSKSQPVTRKKSSLTPPPGKGGRSPPLRLTLGQGAGGGGGGSARRAEAAEKDDDAEHNARVQSALADARNLSLKMKKAARAAAGENDTGPRSGGLSKQHPSWFSELEKARQVESGIR